MDGISPFTPQRVIQPQQRQKTNPWSAVLPSLTQAVVMGMVQNKLNKSLQEQQFEQKMMEQGFTKGPDGEWLPLKVGINPIGETGQNLVTYGNRIGGITDKPKDSSRIGLAPEYDIPGHRAFFDGERLHYQKIDKPDSKVSIALSGEEGGAGPVLDVSPEAALNAYMKMKEDREKPPEGNMTTSDLYAKTHQYWKDKMDAVMKEFGVGGMTWLAPTPEYTKAMEELKNNMLLDYDRIDNKQKPSWMKGGLDPETQRNEKMADEFIRSLGIIK